MGNTKNHFKGIKFLIQTCKSKDLQVKTIKKYICSAVTFQSKSSIPLHMLQLHITNQSKHTTIEPIYDVCDISEITGLHYLTVNVNIQ